MDIPPGFCMTVLFSAAGMLELAIGVADVLDVTRRACRACS